MEREIYFASYDFRSCYTFGSGNKPVDANFASFKSTEALPVRPQRQSKTL